MKEIDNETLRSLHELYKDPFLDEISLSSGSGSLRKHCRSRSAKKLGRRGRVVSKTSRGETGRIREIILNATAALAVIVISGIHQSDPKGTSLIIKSIIALYFSIIFIME
mgnify:CR=1 FL=1